MAYRQLFAVTFAAVGLCLAACSGGPGPSQDLGNGSGSEQPPASSETAPGNPDQPPGNPDQPPGNAGRPPGGGGAITPCTQLCARFPDGCPGNDDINREVRDLCNDDCELVDGKPACAAFVATAIACVSALPGLCTEDGPGGGEACAPAINAAQDCVSDDGGPSPPVTGCTLAGGCNCDGDLCETCRCAGGGDDCDIVCQ